MSVNIATAGYYIILFLVKKIYIQCKEKNPRHPQKPLGLRKLRLWFTWLPSKKTKKKHREQSNPDILSRFVN